MSKALYRKYRSKRLSEIVGQEHVTTVLERALKSGKTGHAYLLTGPRGTGKTSIARILAHEITELPYSDESDHLDIIEIDAASNNGVDDVRELREKALVAPSAAKKKIYIIDEVHMLSKPAFNALLKILEEPPAHVVFILATTDIDKVPATIISRAQRYHFHLIDEEKVMQHLAYIAKEEGIQADDAALRLIAECGGGSFRDSISLLDQLRHSSDALTQTVVEHTLGLASHTEISALLESITHGATEAIIQQLQSIEARGVSSVTLASQLRGSIRQGIAKQPELVHYLEGLSDVAKSHHPDIKLLVTLVQPTAAQSQPAAPTPEPRPRTVATPVQASKKISSPKMTKAKTVKSKPESVEETTKEEPKGQTPSPDNFDWQKVLSYASEHRLQFIGVHSLLAKCTPELRGDQLKLYAGNKFNKSKLDSAKNRATIGKILRETGAGDLDVTTIGTPPPPKDEQAARIAAMMGGGEEVDVS